jgi:drug/metabolite transporter (DMT)-like permease
MQASYQHPEAHGPQRGRLIIALIAVYISWGSTYLAIKVALETYPPLFMMGVRFFVVGAGLFVYLRLRGAPSPTLSHWRNASVIGTFLLLGGSALVAYAEQWVASGLSALVIATTPLWIVLFAGIWKRWPGRLEWAGLLIGLVGVAVLNLEGDLRAHPVGASALLLAAISWAFGSAWSRHMDLPKGMMAGAAEMITGGAVVMAVGFLMGERVPAVVDWRSIGAVVYLGIVGSLVGFTAYMYLLGRVRPALATSYAYVNPVIAVLLGIWFAGERIGVIGIVAMLVILAGVVLVALGNRRS